MISMDGGKILKDLKYGVVLEIKDRETADAFEDYLAEKRYVLFQLQDSLDAARFLFGEASAPDKVAELFKNFLESRRVNEDLAGEAPDTER